MGTQTMRPEANVAQERQGQVRGQQYQDVADQSTIGKSGAGVEASEITEPGIYLHALSGIAFRITADAFFKNRNKLWNKTISQGTQRLAVGVECNTDALLIKLHENPLLDASDIRNLATNKGIQLPEEWQHYGQSQGDQRQSQRSQQGQQSTSSSIVQAAAIPFSEIKEPGVYFNFQSGIVVRILSEAFDDYGNLGLGVVSPTPVLVTKIANNPMHSTRELRLRAQSRLQAANLSNTYHLNF